ncbi:MAG: MBL fold metallo-hydrolase, partial [Bacteroidia bacterium]
MKTRVLFTVITLLLLQTQLSCQDFPYLEDKGEISSITTGNGIDNPVTIKVIYDNYIKVPGMTPDWGYSILIEGLDSEILFDAGTKPDIFESNLKKMNIDASQVDFLVISHEHGDHTGGIPSFAKMKADIPVIIPESFTEDFKKGIVDLGLKPLLVNEPAQICGNLFTSGMFDFEIAEQALVLNTKKGLVVMTGCAHSGIINILRQIRSSFNKDVYMVFGGFHLMDKSEKEMETIISEMKALGV